MYLAVQPYAGSLFFILLMQVYDTPLQIQSSQSCENDGGNSDGRITLTINFRMPLFTFPSTL